MGPFRVAIAIGAVLALAQATAQGPTTSYLFLKGRPGDSTAAYGEGWCWQQMGFLDANGKPPRLQGNVLQHPGGVVVGTKLGPGHWRNNDGSKHMYDLANGETFNGAFGQLAVGGTMVLLTHGAWSGKIVLDNHILYAGFRSTTYPDGTGIEDLDPYPVTGRAGRNATWDLCSCWANKDPDGPAPEKRSVVETARRVVGVAGASGPDHLSPMGFQYDLIGEEPLRTEVLAVLQTINLDNILAGTPFEYQYSTMADHVAAILWDMGRPPTALTSKLRYWKGSAADTPLGSSMALYPIGPAGGTIEVGDATALATMVLPPLAVPTQRYVYPRKGGDVPGLPAHLEPVSDPYDFRWPGESILLGPHARLTLPVRFPDLGAVRILYFDQGRDAWFEANANRTEDPVASTVSVDVPVIGRYVACTEQDLGHVLTRPGTAQQGSVRATLRTGGAASASHLGEQWWYLRLPGDAQEWPLRDDGNLSWSQGGSRLWAHWADLEGRGLGVTLDSHVRSTAPGRGLVESFLVLRNLASGPQTVDVFHYVDVDAGGTTVNEIRGDGSHHLVGNASGADQIDVVAHGATHADVGPANSQELGLADAFVLPHGVLAGRQPPFGPGNGATAFQWSGRTLQPGEAAAFAVVLSVRNVEVYGVGTGGAAGVPVIRATRAPIQGTWVPAELRIEALGATAGQPCALVTGLAPANQMVAGVLLLVDPESAVVTLAIADGPGQAGCLLTVPPAPELNGLPLHHQWLLVEPAGALAASAGLRTVVGSL